MQSLSRLLNGAALGLAARVAAVALAAVAPVDAAEPARFSGALAGRVANSAGVPQMGAAVLLYNRLDQLVSRVVTDERGGFLFDRLAADSYSLRVSLPSFVPALRRNIGVQPGMRSFLAINLSSVLSSIELVYQSPRHAAVMGEDWKWVLRGAQSTRPVLRLLPGIDISEPGRPRRVLDSVFSDTRGLLRVSSGDSGVLAHAGSQADLGTAFALATTLFGSNQLRVSGNLGYASSSGVPTAGFRTTLSRNAADGSAPAVDVTMRQVFLPSRLGAAMLGRQGALPALQTMAVTFHETRRLGDDLELHYGSSIESVSFLDRLNYVSPFARLRWGTAEGGAVEFAFSSGTPATELLRQGRLPDSELQHQLNTLSVFPRISLRDGRAHVQRTENFELGYRREVGARVVSLSAYRESTSNTALMLAGAGGAGLELLPDLASAGSVYNAGRFRRTGYSAALTQSVGENLTASVAYGYAGAVQVVGGLADLDPAQLRSAIRRAWRHSLTGRVSGRAPVAGTSVTASYQATDYAVLHPVHLSLTQRSTLEPGLNLYLKQPIPAVSVKGGRLEASAELRNLLAQGYLPVASGGGRILLIQSPRALRGGVSLIF